MPTPPVSYDDPSMRRAYLAGTFEADGSLSANGVISISLNDRDEGLLHTPIREIGYGKVRRHTAARSYDLYITRRWGREASLTLVDGYLRTPERLAQVLQRKGDVPFNQREVDTSPLRRSAWLAG